MSYLYPEQSLRRWCVEQARLNAGCPISATEIVAEAKVLESYVTNRDVAAAECLRPILTTRAEVEGYPGPAPRPAASKWRAVLSRLRADLVRLLDGGRDA